jgi:hypothetical protein
LHLSVGSAELRASTLAEGTHVERKVDLPDRWVRGLAEVPTLTAAMSLQGELTGPAIVRFLSALPRTQPPGPTLHVRVAPSGWITGHRAVTGSFPIPGASRLRGAERIFRYAERIRVYASDNGTTAWVVDLPGARLMLALSPDPFRGFSGEGTLLSLLTDADAEGHGRLLLDELGWEARVDADDLGRRTGLSSGQVASGLAWLSVSGRLGYDLVEQAWFHRELPVDAEKVITRNPRLASARALADEGGVRDGRTSGTWIVLGSHGNEYAVSAVAAGGRTAGGLKCACPWELEHAGMRGPCKHILAVTITVRRDVADRG